MIVMGYAIMSTAEEFNRENQYNVFKNGQVRQYSNTERCLVKGRVRDIKTCVHESEIIVTESARALSL